MKTMEWVDKQLVDSLRRETIGDVECFVIGEKVMPINAKAPAILRIDAGLYVTVRGGAYHRPGCRHGDTGETYVPILEAMERGALPCTAEPRVRGRWREDTEPRQAA